MRPETLKNIVDSAMDAKRLADILLQLPEGSVVKGNQVGNLSVMQVKEKELFVTGYIELKVDGELDDDTTYYPHKVTL